MNPINNISTRSETYECLLSLSDRFIEQWRCLEARVTSPNAYLGVDYVLPLVKYVEAGRDLFVIAVWQIAMGEEQLIGIGVFDRSTRNILGSLFKNIFSKARNFSSDFVFQSGLLLDQQHSILAFMSLSQELLRQGFGSFTLWNSTELRLPVLSREQLNSLGLKKILLDRKKRMILRPRNAGIEYLESKLSRNRKKDVRRKLRQLQELGELKWSVSKSSSITDKTIQTFLKLENHGWKGDGGTSLMADSGRKLFFEQAIRDLASRDLVFFTEISLDDRVIASTCNLIAGDVGFAFKLGWDRQYAKQSIGFINEYLLIENAPTELSSLRYFDSGAEYDSFLNQLWSDEIDLYSYLYTNSALVYLYYTILSKLRHLKKQNKNNLY